MYFQRIEMVTAVTQSSGLVAWLFRFDRGCRASLLKHLATTSTVTYTSAYRRSYMQDCRRSPSRIRMLAFPTLRQTPNFAREDLCTATSATCHRCTNLNLNVTHDLKQHEGMSTTVNMMPFLTARRKQNECCRFLRSGHKSVHLELRGLLSISYLLPSRLFELVVSVGS